MTSRHASRHDRRLVSIRIVSHCREQYHSASSPFDGERAVWRYSCVVRTVLKTARPGSRSNGRRQLWWRRLDAPCITETPFLFMRKRVRRSEVASTLAELFPQVFAFAPRGRSLYSYVSSNPTNAGDPWVLTMLPVSLLRSECLEKGFRASL